MKILLTGATGLLGNNLLRLFLDDGIEVGVVARGSSDSRPLEGLQIERFNVDFAQDAEEAAKGFREALDGVDVVVHCAGVIQIGWSKRNLSMRVNRDASEEIADACRMRGIRLVHVSSVDALAEGTLDRPATEDDIDPAKIDISYVASKRAADQVVWEQMSKGLDAVIVHPGLMFGPWDWKPSSGQMILAIAKQFIPFAPSGGISVCDVRDTANGILSAIKNWRSGESYILAGENTTYLELWQRIAKLLNRKAPFGKLPGWLGNVVGKLSDLGSKFSKAESQSNSGAIKLGTCINWYSSEKAKKDLGYQIGDIEVALADAIEWFRTYDYLKR